MRFPGPFLATLLFLLVLAGTARAEDPCLARVVDEDLAVKLAFQDAQRDLFMERAEDYEGLIRLHHEFQTTLLRSRHAAMLHLLEIDPGRLDSSSLSALRSFDWTEEEDEALRESDPAYRELAEERDILREHNDTHPDWPALRGHVQSTVLRTPAFKAMMTDFSDNQRRLREMLAECRD